MSFRDRTEAGRRLAQALLPHRNAAPVVLALPRGGVPIAAEVAQALGAPLDLVIVRKIGVPQEPELAMGAVVDTSPPLTVTNDAVVGAAGISAGEFAAIRDRELAEATRRHGRYLGRRSPVPLAGKTAIIIDDGIATGASMRAALAAVRQGKPRQVIVAVPVAPPDTIAELRNDADAVVCLEVHEPFGAIGAYYDDFRQVTDEEVVALLQEVRPAAPAPRDRSRS